MERTLSWRKEGIFNVITRITFVGCVRYTPCLRDWTDASVRLPGMRFWLEH